MAQRVAPRNLVVRYTMSERVVHWTVALSFLYVMFTGLALFWPPFFWLADVFGSGPVIRVWHPIVGLVFAAVLAVMFTKWVRDMFLDGEDRKWLAHVREYATGEDRGVPEAGRFNAGQKLLFWLQLGSAVLLVLSGVVLWFPGSFGRALREASFIVHDLAAIAAIGGIILHIYMGVFVTRGSVQAMTRGTVSPRWAEAHHGRWFKMMRSGSPAPHR